ncbi:MULTISPECIES: hypothetical protein [Hydrogenophaga]|uniref:Uncharacterized protein n=1 Tax=Hydrogenophaga electricum TaxID=1230953 RepID=A0ABQ6C479_9BURK|nr:MULTISPECIES: hypothetical protein [Hydrogenophaga]GLS14554.1 hypothetical protein GCM10007935_19850 [Hydrogenophaga electricum]
MKTALLRLTLGLLAGLAAWPVLAEVDPSQGPKDPCRAEVSRFEQVIGFVRQSQGNQAAAALKESLLPAKVENDILMREGYCGLARYLREKKLTR